MLRRVILSNPWWRNSAAITARSLTNSRSNKNPQLRIEICEEENDSKSRSNSGRTNLNVFIKGAVTGAFAAFGLWGFKSIIDWDKYYLEAAQIIGNNDSQPPKNSRRKQFNFVADVVKEAGGSLVYIKIKDRGYRDYYTGEPTQISNGSGFIVESDGLILTNAHVVEGRPRSMIEIQLQDGRTFMGRVEDMDRQSDLATVRIDCKDPLPAMKLGTY